MIAFLREPLAINSLAKSGNVTRSPSEKQVDILNQLKTNSITAIVRSHENKDSSLSNTLIDYLISNKSFVKLLLSSCL